MVEFLKIVYEGGEGEITEKKSRFICSVQSVRSEEEALAFIQNKKKQYWDARHNCSAYVIGEHNEIARFSDDGEPQGTAGKPMLDVLMGRDIHHAVAVVTRYFGGVLLGTGGLVRAYQAAVNEGLKNSIILQCHTGQKYCIVTSYGNIEKIRHISAMQGYYIADTIYTEQVEMYLVAPGEQQKELIEKITEVTAATAEITSVGPVHYGISEQQELILLDQP